MYFHEQKQNLYLELLLLKYHFNNSKNNVLLSTNTMTVYLNGIGKKDIAAILYLPTDKANKNLVYCVI